MNSNEEKTVVIQPIMIVTDDPFECLGGYDDVLYYESHVTIEPVFGIRLQALKNIAKRHGFYVANLIMQNDEINTRDTFCSGRSSKIDDLADRMTSFIADLTSCLYDVWRYKIEAILVDVRRNR